MTQMEAQAAIQAMQERIAQMREDIEAYIEAKEGQPDKRRKARITATAELSPVNPTSRTVKLVAIVVWMLAVAALIVGSAGGM